VFAILIPAAWTIAFLALLGAGRPAREAALIAFTVITAAVLVLIETLSAFAAITPLWIGASWAGLSVLGAILLRTRVVAGVARLREPVAERWGAWDVVTALVLGIFAAGALASALLYPATNNDSLAYHMPRIFFWFQNHSVSFYPTADARQLFSSPLVEYFALNLKALALGSDRLAGLVQWLSYVFSLIAVSLVAARLGATRRGQQVATVVAASVPMAVLQATTTQTDLTCALWILVTVYCVASVAGQERTVQRISFWWALWAGTSAGLAIQAKPTAYLVLWPFFLWLVRASFARCGWKRAAALGGVSLLCVVLLNSAWYLRNAEALNGDFLALTPPDNQQILIQARDPVSIATTALKNTSMLLGTPSARVNGVITDGVRAIVRTLGADIENPLTKLNPTGPFSVEAAFAHHDLAPAPFTLALVGLAALILLSHRSMRSAPMIGYASCAAVAFAVCAGLLRWNPWITRILLAPLLVLAPIVGVAFTVVEGSRERVLNAVLGCALALAVALGLLAMTFDATNPLVPQPWGVSSAWNAGYWESSYARLHFKMNAEYEAPFEAVATAARQRGIQRIGVYQYFKNFNIYPMLSLLPDVRWGYVGDTKLPELLDPNAFSPQAILELVPTDQYPAVLGDGAPRGTELLPPQRTSDAVILFYQVP